ncbi:MAG TPA: glycine cleavage T C-terminal barrel domain-containing protein, partial [Steroidobacteraceae bacterium]|nr:glycine cleavage T C-terminal barrel domain-containing protein [Steroidobacteraceae bacterium]
MVYNHTYFPLTYLRAPAEEYLALTEAVTLWDVACERQTEVRGPDAAALVDYLTTRKVDDLPVGACRYTLVCDPEGRIMCDPVLLHPWPDVYWLSHGDVDLTLWARGLALGRRLEVVVSEPDVAPLQVQGPKALEVLRGLTEMPLEELGRYKCQATRVAGVPAVVSRTGWSGGPGYEVFPLSSERALHLWQALLEAGRPHGLRVTGPNINRAVEKGVTDTSYYSNSDLNPFEAGHERLVDLEKGEFVGRAALEGIARAGAARKTVGLRASEPLPLLEWYWPVESAGRRVGEVRWACHSFALGAPVAIAVVERALERDAALTIVHGGGRTPARIVDFPFL